MTTIAPIPARTPIATSIPPTPGPAEPPVPAEVLALATKPLFSARYTGVEKESWYTGVPLVSTKLHSQRDIAFTNNFNILTTNEPMITYSAATLDDAIRSAQYVAYRWSTGGLGGLIDASCAMAVLETPDHKFFSAMIGTGNPKTTEEALAYRSDRFDNNIYGSLRKATDAAPTSSWSAPVDKHGTAVNAPAPADDSAITKRHVEAVQLDTITPATSMLKAVVDFKNVWRLVAQ